MFSCRFQKYQQQLQQKHGHSSQSSPLNQTAEGLASTSELSPGDGRRFSLGHAGGPVGGVGQAGTFSGGAQVNLFFNCVIQGIRCPHMGTVAKWDCGVV